MTKQEGEKVSVQMKTLISDGEQKQVIELHTEGRLYDKDQGMFLQFKEEIEEIGQVNQIVKVDNDETITVIRQGAVSMKQLFQLQKKTEGVYKSQFGIMLMNTATSYINVHIDRDKIEGSIQWTYLLHMQDEFAGNYHVTITFRRM